MSNYAFRFLRIVLPRTNSDLRKEVTSRSSYSVETDKNLPYTVEHALGRIFQEELRLYKIYKIAQQDMIRSWDFSVMGAFKDIDTKDRGYFDHEEYSYDKA